MASLTATSGGGHSESSTAGLQHQTGGAYPAVGALGLHAVGVGVGVGQLASQEYHSHAVTPAGTTHGHAAIDDLMPWNRPNAWPTQGSIGQATQAPGVNNHHMSAAAAAMCHGAPTPQNGTATFNEVFSPAPAANGYLTGADFGQFYYPGGQLSGAGLRGLTL